MVVQHNIPAMNANRYYNINNSGLSKSLEKLSSGYQINRAGDNAAGLAVSEKMRSQIGGLTQGVKNAQDGISMIQTYEGALTETDAILQRMKTLADQAANGTYQDDVDREAIQLEFDQLNDELNQIADTDYNGVVMLNGGQMADGTKAVDGKFDYANGTRAARQLSSADINTLDAQAMDNKTTDDEYTTVADALWKDFGFERGASDVNKADDGPDSVDVTFKYDSTTRRWSAVSATGGADVSTLTTSKANNGGFMVGSTGAVKTNAHFTTPPTPDKNLVNVVLDDSKLVNGDTIVIRFNNPSVKKTSIENIGVADKDTGSFTAGSKENALTKEDADLKVEYNNEVLESTNKPNNETKMNKDYKELLDMINGAKVEVNYSTGSRTPSVTAGAAMSITMTGTDGKQITKSSKKDGSGDGTFKINETEFKVTFDKDEGAIKIGTEDHPDLIKLTAAKKGANDDGSQGKIVYTLAVDAAKYSDKAKGSAELVQPEGVVSKSNSNDYATAPLTYTDNLTLQAGARTKDSVNFTFRYASDGLGDLKANMDCSAREGGLNTASLSLRTQKDANYAIDRIDNAINKISMVRATFGATQNRLEHKIDNMNVTKENITSAESRIRDTDINEEMAAFTKNQILSQASQSMLAQANSLPQNVLQLLG